MKRLLPLAVVAASALLLAGCGSGSASQSGDARKVVASFYPFAYVAEQVGGKYVDVQNLTHPGVEPHDIELKPREIGNVQGADLMVYEHGFQASVDDALEQADLPKSKTIDVGDLVVLKKATADEEGGHEHGGTDPHVWLDPKNMITITDAVASKLADQDPDHAQAYRANAKAFVGRLRTLDKDYRAGLAHCARTQFVTSHAAFAYLADEYGLQQVPIAGIDPTTEPSAKQLAEITNLVRDEHITTIFTEDLVSPKIADTIARETGAKTDTLSPIEGLTDDTRGETYLSLMRENLSALQKANDCS